jgi:hypothetical protein
MGLAFVKEASVGLRLECVELTKMTTTVMSPKHTINEGCRLGVDFHVTHCNNGEWYLES